MVAPRNQNNGTWIDNFEENEQHSLAQMTRPMMNNVYEIKKMRKLVTFIHVATGFPVVNTWAKAI